jgi:hypothetical protein
MPAPLIGVATAAAAKAVAKKVATNAAKKTATKAVTKQTAEALKKSGLEKLAKINRTKVESDISFALRHGKITKQEAAAIDPKNFKILLDNSKTKTIAIVNPKTGKVTRGK